MSNPDYDKAFEELQAMRAATPSWTSERGWAKDNFPNAPDLMQAYDQAKGDHQIQQQAEVSVGDATTGTGSQQVKDTGLRPEMRPPPEIAKEPDREKHQAEMARDDAAAKAKDEWCQKAADEYEAYLDSRSQEQDRGLER